jgi:TRAP-type C4-dicarboxylate transport system permease large subunit
MPIFIANFLFSITSDKYIFLLIINLFMLFLGCFIESIAGLLIIMPIILPVALQLGIDPVHFGVVCCYNMMIGAITPPMGACVFIVCGVADTKFDQVVKKLWPFLIAHIVTLILITYIPIISLWIPSW